MADVTRPAQNGQTSKQPSPLETLLAPLSPVTIDDAAGSGDPVWLQADGWRVLARPRFEGRSGEEIERFSLPDGRTVSARVDQDTNEVFVPFNLSAAYVNFVYERWCRVESLRSLPQWQLKLYYRVKGVIPRLIQLRARRMLIGFQQEREFPAWPLDESVSRLLRFYARCLLVSLGADELRFRWFWPRRYRSALLLTHDVESAEGLRLAVDVADLEEERGLRSSFNLCADWYSIDWGIVHELRARGFELGLHGVFHDRSMFSSRAMFDAQQPALRTMADKLGAVGFRSPATHRVIDWLAELPVFYDCSVPHSDPYEPQPGGCCSLWPFFIGDVVELPYTLPQDHTLLTLLGHTTIDLWRRQLERIEELNGLAQMLTHPDPGYLGDPRKRALYVEFLDFVRDRAGLWTALPRDVAQWWRDRATASSSDERLGTGTARLEDKIVFEAPRESA